MIGKWKFDKAHGERIELYNSIKESFSKNWDPNDVIKEIAGQNANDAAINDNQIIKTVITLSKTKLSDKDIVSTLFSDLHPHLKSTKEKAGNDIHIESNAIENLENFNEIKFLAIEDFKTTGIDAWESYVNSHWYSYKSGAGKGGSKGVGKTTMVFASKIGTYFFDTITEDCPDDRFMGKTLLKYHTFGDEDTEYKPFGSFIKSSVCDQENTEPVEHYNHPVTDSEYIHKIKKAFGLKREQETGVSQIIIDPVEGITTKEIIKVILNRLFMPILTGKQTIEFITDDISNPIIFDSTLPDKLENIIDESGLRNSDDDDNTGYTDDEISQKIAMYKFIEHAASTPIGEYKKSNDLGKKPNWNDIVLYDPDKLLEIKKDYQDQKPIYLKINLKVTKKDPEEGLDTKLSYFRIAIQKDSLVTNVNSSNIILTRHRMMMDNKDKTSGYRALLMTSETPEDDYLGEMLRYSEDPTHTDWIISNDKAKAYFQNSTAIISFVKKSIRRIVTILNPEGDATDYTDPSLNSWPKRIPSSGGGRQGPGVHPTKPTHWVATNTDNSIIYTYDKDSGPILNSNYKIDLVFCVARNDKVSFEANLGQYSTLDFNFLTDSNFSYITNNVTCETLGPNKLEVKYNPTNDSDISIEVLGFGKYLNIKSQAVVKEFENNLVN